MTAKLPKTTRPPEGNFKGKVHPLVGKLIEAIASDDDVAADQALDKINEALANPPIPELWGVKDVAEYLGIRDYQNVYKRVGKGLPEPVKPGGKELRRGQLWRASDIRAYGRQRRRRKGK